MGTCANICKENSGIQYIDHPGEIPISSQRSVSWSDVPKLIKAVISIQRAYRSHKYPKNKLVIF